MKLVLIGTDHCLQHAIVRDDKTKVWVPRKGFHRYRKLIAYCIDKLGARAILEETHPNQQQTAPTIASSIAKERDLVWQTLGLGEPGLSDVLFDPETMHPGVKLEMLAGILDLEIHKIREESMYRTIMDSMRRHECVLAIVGYVHLEVLARMFEVERVPAVALLFTPLVVDETRS
jgi:hypothetical protein